MVVAAVAAGAFAAAAAGQTLQSFGTAEAEGVAPLANTTDASANFALGGDAPMRRP